MREINYGSSFDKIFLYNFFLALLPLFISFFVRHISNVNHLPGIYTPELLFFSIMISATALGDITDETKLYKLNITIIAFALNNMV